VLVTLHHIIADGWSLGVLIREVKVLYEAFTQGEEPRLESLPVQYVDYAVWQRAWMRGEVLERQLSHWTQYLRGVKNGSTIPGDRPRQPSLSFRGKRQWVSFPRHLSDSLKDLSRREGVTLFMALMAAFKTLIHRYTGDEDIVIGTDVANRNRVETENLIGFFVNQMVFRADLSGDPRFRDLLQRVRDVALRAYNYQDLPFEQLVEALKLERSIQYLPLFQIKLVLQNAPIPSMTLSQLKLSTLKVDGETTKYDLTLSLEETDQGLEGWVEYSTDLFDSATINKILGHYQTLLASVAAEPDRPLSSLEIYTANEREQLVMEQKKREEINLSKFKGVQLKPVTLPEVGLIKSNFLDPERSRWLLIEPGVEGLDLVDWVRGNQELVERKILNHGGILFRGFNVNSSSIFEQFAQSVCSELFNENGEHPRKSVSGNVYTPVFYPPDKQLLWHNENSFNYRWPMKILFCCIKPADAGGETPIVDSRKVFEMIDPAIREQFQKKKIMYVRNYDEALGLSWRTVFNTENPRKVEDMCRASSMEFEWKENDRLKTRCVRPAVLDHPSTGETVWWNQAQHWHISCLDKATRESLLILFADEDLPRHCYYGDGSAIENSIMESICEVYEKLEFSFKWQAGDVIVLDNMLTAHARNPFKGERKLLVAMGNMHIYAEN
jgi:alpha-ketoglutarate-dependent taurine dioxygenase